MEEKQINQNLNQQSAQGPSQAEEQPTVSMQIQQLLVKQQKYQQQYNQLVDYVKKTPNLPIEQVNQIKQQLDWLNTLFVQGKQQLQALGYNQVQVNKPTEIKKGAKSNFSLKRMVIGCGIILFLIFAGFLVTLTSLIKNPNALLGIGIDASNAKIILQAFTGLLFGSFILLMIGIIIANIYRIITVKNQGKGRYVLGLFGGIFGALVSGSIIALMFSWISKIVVEIENVEYDLVQPYLVGRVENIGSDEFLHPYDNKEIKGIGKEYSLVAPAEMAFSLRINEFTKYLNQNVPTDSENFDITLSCGNNTDKKLPLMKDDKGKYILDGNGGYKFQGTCLYDSVGEYKYSINVSYDNKISKEREFQTKDVKSLKFDSEISIYKTKNPSVKLKSSKGEINLGEAPSKITIDSAQIFRDFGLGTYEIEWDMDGDFVSDRSNQVSFDYSYKVPKVYYVTYKIPGLLNDTWYRFPVRVEQSNKPICGINVTNFPGTTKYQISTDFVDASSAATISSYRYTIQNTVTKKTLEVLNDYPQEFSYNFPEEGNYVVILDYITVDKKQGQCESDTIGLKKETFRVQYSIKDLDLPDETCNSDGTRFDKCTQINLNEMPKTYQLQIKSISPYSTTLRKVVSLDGKPILNDNDTYTFSISSEGTYNLSIAVSDEGKGIEETAFNIKFIAKKDDIVGNFSILSSDTRDEISEGFEPLTVILDASKTEVNIPGDEIIYFTRDFGDGEIKRNQQNGVVAHTYNYDYAKENGIFQPVVSVRTKNGVEKNIYGPVINVKKGLINVDIYSESHPSRQAPVGKDVSFSAEFDGLPEKMTWDFGDGTVPISCVGRNCTEITHIFDKTGLFPVKLTLDFDAVQQVEGMVDFKVY